MLDGGFSRFPAYSDGAVPPEVAKRVSSSSDEVGRNFDPIRDQSETGEAEKNKKKKSITC